MGKDFKNMNEEEEERYSVECCGVGWGMGGLSFMRSVSGEV